MEYLTSPRKLAYVLWAALSFGLIIGFSLMTVRPLMVGVYPISWMIGFVLVGCSLLALPITVYLTCWLNLRDKTAVLLRRSSGIFMVTRSSPRESEVALANGTRLRTVMNVNAAMPEYVAYFYESDQGIVDVYEFHRDGLVRWSTSNKRLGRSSGIPGYFKLTELRKMLQRYGVAPVMISNT
jgi:hypothetical protein